MSHPAFLRPLLNVTPDISEAVIECHTRHSEAVIECPGILRPLFERRVHVEVGLQLEALPSRP